MAPKKYKTTLTRKTFDKKLKRTVAAILNLTTSSANIKYGAKNMVDAMIRPPIMEEYAQMMDLLMLNRSAPIITLSMKTIGK